MMMKCISREEGIQLFHDIHNGICGCHSSWCSIIGKAFRHEFYWPTTKDDVMEIATKCRDCQVLSEANYKAVNALHPINLSWSFIIWGINIMGMLPRAPRGYMFLFVTINTLPEWMEAMSMGCYR
jgi:hypothetical protein